eukprot:symbB.v1.2.024713.t1/scaffold2359.1/size81413/3
MMARLRLREELYSKLFPRKSWAMPEEFYPVDLTPELEEQVRKAVSQTVEAWKPKDEDVLKPTSLEAAEQIVSQGRLTELDAEERLSLACEKAPTDDEIILLLRDAYKSLATHYKQITDMEKEEVRALGGLLVLGTERHESRRIDNQLRGRCARQGDPGATRFFLSLNDTIFRIFGGDNIKQMMSMMSLSQPDDVPLESGLLSNSLEEAQKKCFGAMANMQQCCCVLLVFVFLWWLFMKVFLMTRVDKSHLSLQGQASASLDSFLDRGAAANALQALQVGNFKKTLEELQGCNEAPCMTLRGEMQISGLEVVRNLEDAMDSFKAAAEAGDPEAQYALGVLYANLLEDDPEELHKNEGLSILYLYAASVAKHPGALMAMGYRHREGLAVPQSCSTAALNYIEVARQVAHVYSSGMPQAVELVRLGVEDDRHQMSFSKMAFVEIAASGDANVAAAVGKRYLLGVEGFPQDFARAQSFLNTAVEQRHPGALGLLGYMYSLGLGVPKDLDAAYQYFKDAAMLDDPLGLNGLGFIYFQGTTSTNQDLSVAFQQFNRSAHRGNADGMFNLASVYLTGSGTEQSFQKATQWYTQALDRGHTPAAYALAVMHLNGIGTVRNCQLAVDLLKRVCERGNWVTDKLREAQELHKQSRFDAATWRFLTLAEAGHEVAQMNVAQLFDNGQSHLLLNSSQPMPVQALEDPRLLGRAFAQRHYELSAEQGNALSELRLGDYAYYGWGLRYESDTQTEELDSLHETWQLSRQDSDFELSLAHYRQIWGDRCGVELQ